MYKILATQEVPGKTDQELINLALNVLNNKNIRVFTIEEQRIFAENPAFIKDNDSKLVLICKDEIIELSTTDTLETSFPDRSHIKKCKEIAKEIEKLQKENTDLENDSFQNDFIEIEEGVHLSKEDMENQERAMENFIKMSDYSFASKPFTWISISVSVFMFIIILLLGGDIFNPDNMLLFEMGANLKNATLDGEWWRLITSTILHGGIIHLAMNMYLLFLLGTLLETFLGTKKVAVAYILSGLLASLASTWWYDTNIVSVGASGAVFGLLGMLLFFVLIKDKDFNLVIKKESLFMLVLANIAISFKDGIDGAAHFGGLFAGILIAIVYYLFRDDKYKEKINMILTGMTFVFMSFTIVALIKMDKVANPMDFIAKSQELEREFTNIWNNPVSDTSAAYTRSSQIWNEIHELTETAIEPLKNRKEVYNHFKKWSQYSKLNSEHYYLLTLVPSEDTARRLKEIEEELNILTSQLYKKQN